MEFAGCLTLKATACCPTAVYDVNSTEHIDWSRADHARFPNLKPATRAISLRLPVSLLDQIKIAANKRDVPYQFLIKAWLSEKVSKS